MLLWWLRAGEFQASWISRGGEKSTATNESCGTASLFPFGTNTPVQDATLNILNVRKILKEVLHRRMTPGEKTALEEAISYRSSSKVSQSRRADSAPFPWRSRAAVVAIPRRPTTASIPLP